LDTELNEQIKALAPFDQMNEGEIASALENSEILDIPKGKMVFKRGEETAKVYWLLSGAVDLLNDKFEAMHRQAGEDVTKNPIDNNSPHRLTAVTTKDAKLLSCDRATVGMLFGESSSGQDEQEDGIDWMSTLLSSPLFEFIPPTNIQTLFGRFEAVTYKAGEVIVSQGEKGDYFYVIQAGRARVERTVKEKKLLLAELKPGDNFGQDALVCDAPRNATVTMTSNGTLMRLSEPDFQSLLVKPVIESINEDELDELLTQSEPKAYILDVRTPSEVAEDKIPGSLNVPLLLLRKNLSKLKAEAIYIVACDGGARSKLGTYQLNEEGFTAYVLKRK